MSRAKASWCWALLLLTLAFGEAKSRGEDWPRFRGPHGNDIAAESSGYKNGWRPKSMWSDRVGEGGSSPIVVQGKVYTLGFDGAGDTLACRDLDNGKVLWSKRYDGPKYGRHSTGDKSLYSGCSSTPEFDAGSGNLFTLSTDGELRSWASEDGQLNWRVNLYDRFMAPRRPDVGGRRSLRDYGYTTSPLIYKSWVIAEVGAKSGTVAAFEKASGKLAWTSECRDEAGHTAGPVYIEVEGKPCLAVLTLRNLVVMSLAKETAGKTIGSASWTTDFGNNIASPAVYGSSLVVTSAYNQSAMARFDVTGAGLKQRWRTDGVASGVCTPIVDGAHIYWAWRGVHCVDFETGREKWVGGKVGSAASCVLTKDKRLIVLADRGDLTLVDSADLSPTKYVERAKLTKQLASDVWPHLALSNGKLLCKDRKGNLRCYDLRP